VRPKLVTGTVRSSHPILVIYDAGRAGTELTGLPRQAGRHHHDPVMTSHLPDGQPGFDAKAW
jgi:hypothetical protein